MRGEYKRREGVRAGDGGDTRSSDDSRRPVSGESDVKLASRRELISAARDGESPASVA